MPVVLDTPAAPARGAYDVEIGLLNNLGDGGMESGERQLIDLLELGCGGARVRLRLFSLPAIERGAEAGERMARLYQSHETLVGGSLDGLFVTGAEPREPDLLDEDFWPQLTAVIDWAKDGHALDDLVVPRRPRRRAAPRRHRAPAAAGQMHRRLRCLAGRRPSPACRLGCGAAAGLPLPLERPRRRRAGRCRLRRPDARGAGGVDSFVRRFGSEFVFLQGHPEYDAGALGREARRDLARWQADPSRLPSLPTGYFTPKDEAALRAHVAAGDVGAALPEIDAPLPSSRDLAVALFRNWLALLGTSAARAA